MAQFTFVTAPPSGDDQKRPAPQLRRAASPRANATNARNAIPGKLRSAPLALPTPGTPPPGEFDVAALQLQSTALWPSIHAVHVMYCLTEALQEDIHPVKSDESASQFAGFIEVQFAAHGGILFSIFGKDILVRFCAAAFMHVKSLVVALLEGFEVVHTSFLNIPSSLSHATPFWSLSNPNVIVPFVIAVAQFASENVLAVQSAREAYLEFPVDRQFSGRPDDKPMSCLM